MPPPVDAIIGRMEEKREPQLNRTNRSYIEDAPPETAANTLICLIHQANYLFDRPVCSVPVRAFVETQNLASLRPHYKRLYSDRRHHRQFPSNSSHRSDDPQNPARR